MSPIETFLAQESRGTTPLPENPTEGEAAQHFYCARLAATLSGRTCVLRYRSATLGTTMKNPMWDHEPRDTACDDCPLGFARHQVLPEIKHSRRYALKKQNAHKITYRDADDVERDHDAFIEKMAEELKKLRA